MWQVVSVNPNTPLTVVTRYLLHFCFVDSCKISFLMTFCCGGIGQHDKSTRFSLFLGMLFEWKPHNKHIVEISQILLQMWKYI